MDSKDLALTQWNAEYGQSNKIELHQLRDKRSFALEANLSWVRSEKQQNSTNWCVSRMYAET